MVRTRTTAVLALVGVLAASAGAATSLDTVLLKSGLTRPTWAGSPPGDKHRIFVTEQWTGQIKILKDGVQLATPFLTIAGLPTNNEQGLLSMAFDPNYDSNGRFYVYMNPNSTTVAIRRYTVSANPDVANAASVTTLITIPHPSFTNHNGGNLKFGLDGFLYAGVGDGGSANDPNCNAQNLLERKGKMLRLDVNNPPTYVPASNPFVGNTSVDPLVYYYGLRNPWRWDIDPDTGDIYIADVGQNQVEEIDYRPSTTTGGENFGWRVMEGLNCPNTQCNGAPACNSPLYTNPIWTYTHASGNCSVTGGVVYRGCAIPDLKGTYFFADYCSAQIWSFQVVGGAVTNFINRTAELDPAGALAINNPVHFGRDACGEILIVDQAGGELYKVVPATLAAGTDLGNGKVGSNGKIPDWRACGLLDTGNSASFTLSDAPANRAAVLFVSLGQNPVPVLGGTLVPQLPVLFTLTFVTDANGELNLGSSPGGGGPLTVYTQWLLDDPGLPAPFVGFSNALQLNFLP